MSDFIIDIDRYLDGNMSEEDKIAFETKVAADPELAEALQLQKDMRALYSENDWIDSDASVLQQEKAQELSAFFRSEEAAAVKNTISEVIAENRSKHKTPKTYWWIGVAASVAILLGVSSLVFRGNNYDELYSQYIQVEDIPSLVTRGEEKEELLQEAQVLFEDKKFQEAIKVFKTYQNTSGVINPLSYIYAGIAYLEEEEFNQAIHQFDLLEKSNTLQSKKGNWFKAMTYLKQGKKNKLKSVLEQILSDAANYKYAEAKELFETIF